MPDTLQAGEVAKPPSEIRNGWRLAAGTAIIFLLVLAAYTPALRGQFIWDDTLLVDKNPLVKGDLSLRSIWFHTDFPLTNVVFWTQWLVWGKNPAGYHAVNVFLHAISAVLLWGLLARLRIRGAWLAAVLFAVHPVCVASVAWISELKNTLSLPFFLLSIRWYLSFEEQPVENGKKAATQWYWLSLAAFFLALLSKTSTVMLPVVLIGCAWWQRGRVTRRDWLRTGPFIALALVLGLMSVWFQHQVVTGEPVQTENFLGRLAGAGRAGWFYLGKALLPLNLNMIYPHWKIDSTAPASYLPALFWCGVFALCWRFRRTWGRPALFGLGCFIVTLFPVLGFFDMYFMALSRVSDHFQYVPLIAVVAMVAAGLCSLLPPRSLRFVVLALVLALSVLTLQRARVFASDETLWRDTLAKNPEAWTAHNNLGCILAGQQKYDEAISHFAASLRFNPGNAGAHCNLGRALSLQGRFAEAEPHFQAALKIKPQDAETHRSYASALAGQGNMEAALQHLREALRLEPDISTRLQLASFLHATGRVRETIAQYRQVLSLQPDEPEALNNLAWILATSSDDTVRDGPEGVRLAEQACRLTGYKKPLMIGTLAAAYAEAGRFSDAVAMAAKAADLAASAGDRQFAGINQQLLQLYRAGKPYHEPPATAARPHPE
jgi:tetratricopeptide (TPR) repeat protein